MRTVLPCITNPLTPYACSISSTFRQSRLLTEASFGLNTKIGGFLGSLARSAVEVHLPVDGRRLSRKADLYRVTIHLIVRGNRGVVRGHGTNLSEGKSLG